MLSNSPFVLALLFSLNAGAIPKPVEAADPPEGESDAPKPESGDEKRPAPAEATRIPVEAATESAKAEAKQEAKPGADDFFQFSDFVDTRVTFALTNVNVLAGPGERTYPTSGYRIGVDKNFNLFLENTNTRFTGFESLSHLVLYKKLPAFWETWETEAALAALILADTDTGKLSLFDSGTYLRLIKKFGTGPEQETGSFDLTAFPVSADRFRLGYTYLVSWGGTSIFPGKLQSSSITEGAVPGLRFRIRGPKGQDYAFLGFKSALLLTRQPGVAAGEQVPNYAVLAGGGTTLADTLILEANGGLFQKGTQERIGLEGQQITAYGASARITIYQGAPPTGSADYQLYRNDPTAPAAFYVYKDYVPGDAFSVAVEGSLLGQNLEDPEHFGTDKVVPALSAGLVGIAKLEHLLLRLDAFYKSIDFILFNVPGFVPFQAIPAGASTTPEFFAALTAEYTMESVYMKPSLAIGVKMPATYRGEVLNDQGSALGGAKPGELRTQIIVDDTTRVVLPPTAKNATPVVGAVLKWPVAISQSTAIAGEFRMEINDNQPRLQQDNERGEVTYFFDKPLRLSVGLVLQSKW